MLVVEGILRPAAVWLVHLPRSVVRCHPGNRRATYTVLGWRTKSCRIRARVKGWGEGEG